MEWMLYIVAALFCVLGLFCVLSIVLSLPGGWLLLGLAVIVEFSDRLYLPAERAQTFPWWLLGSAAGLLLLGEIIEFAAGAAGVKTGGGSRRGMIGALIGGVIGAIVLTGFIPVPVVGTLIGAMIGTFIGAVMGEVTGAQPKSVGGSMKPALGATVGRVVGTMSKIGIALALWIALSVAAFIP